MLFWKDNQFVEQSAAVVSVLDHGFLYGDGIFEGFRFFDGKVLFAEEHVERLMLSARAISLAVPFSHGELIDALQTMASKHGGDGYIRLVVSRGAGQLGIDPRTCETPTVVAIACPVQLYKDSNGIHLIISSVTRNISAALDPRIKSLNYLNNILAKMQATAAGADEAVMLNNLGYVSECTTENIIVIKGRKAMCPSASDGALDGVTKIACMGLLEQMGFEVSEERLNSYDLYTADEIILTGTGAGVIRAASLDGRKYQKTEIFEALAESYSALIKRECNARA